MTFVSTLGAPMPAAIFDLDRTLIAGSSTPIFTRHLETAGLGPGIKIPLMDQFYKLFENFGENMAAMQIAKFAARANKGWPVEVVEEAATAAAVEIVGALQPFAPQVIDEHRAAGHKLVMATTSPSAFVAPLAELLGFDAVVSTEWDVTDEHYNGSLAGPFLWGREKMLAVTAWAQANNIDLDKSHAYSDSFYDGALLDAVGNPHAVNPDPKLKTLATVKGWPIRHLDVSPGVIKIGGLEIQDWLRPLGRPELVPYASFDITNIEKIPEHGPVILVFNHRSYFDPTAVALLMSKSGRSVRFLGKREVFDTPVLGSLSRGLGGIPVDRATGSDEPLEAAAAALAGGEIVAMAPQGTIPRGPAFFDPVLQGRWGAARLAALSGAPVIPVGLWGTERVWPRSSRMPKLAVPRPQVSLCVGDAVNLKTISVDESSIDTTETDSIIDTNTRSIMSALVALLPAEASEAYEPTEEQLALTYPPGYTGDADQEQDRRPGTNT